jgi:hypothetical protein
MLRIFLVILLVLHGSIHVLGFLKSLNPDSISQLKQSISSGQGIVWLITAIIFLVAAALALLHNEYWWILTWIAMVLSQFLIIQSWADARFGTIANILILFAVIIGFSQWRFAATFREDVKDLLQTSNTNNKLTEQDIHSLPEPVKKYIRYTGHLGKSKTSTFKAAFEGQIRSSEKSAWMEFKASQYSMIDIPARYFFIKASMKGIPVDGYHRFKNGKATMDIRAASLVKVQFAQGREMDVAETVTHFNDMCILAPGSLTNSRITWKKIKDNEVDATFTNKGITIHATLQFNDKGELVNFISDDRYFNAATKQMQKLRWMTPVSGYKETDGIRFPTFGEAIWVLPEGNFTYAKMNINSVRINPGQ